MNNIIATTTNISASTSVPASVLSPFQGLGVSEVIVMMFFVLLVVAIKGYALWYAARRDEKWWFMSMLVINLFGFLEIFYLLVIVKRWPKIFNGFGGSATVPQKDSGTDISSDVDSDKNSPKQ